MKKSQFSEEQIIGMLWEAEGETPVGTVCAKHNISQGTFYKWRSKFGGYGRQRGPATTSDGGKEQPVETGGGRFNGASTDSQGGERKKVASPSAKRRAIQGVIESGLRIDLSPKPRPRRKSLASR